MSYFLKQSVAVTLKLGPFVDATDGFTAETALTISQADIRLSKNGGAFAQTNNAAGATHDEAGEYGVPLDTTDTNTLGTLKVRVSETGARPVSETCMVLPANVWDSLFGADLLQVDAREWLGTAAATPTVAGVPEVDLTHWRGTAAPAEDTAGYPKVTIKDGTGTGEIDTTSGGVLVSAIAPGAITSGAIATDAIGSDELAASAVNEIADQVWDEAIAGHLGAGSTGAKLNATGDPWATALPGAYAAGQAGKIVGDNVNAPVTGVPAAVWSYTTRTLTNPTVPLVISSSAGEISQVRGDSWSVVLLDLGPLTGAIDVWFTAKTSTADVDTAAILQISLTVGLERLNGAAGTAGQGSIVVNDAASGDITVNLDELASAALPPGAYTYDVQSLIGSTVKTHQIGTLTVLADVTRATS